jgi:hypothetical protein
MQAPILKPPLFLTNNCAWSLPNLLSKQAMSQWEFLSLALEFTNAVKNNADYIPGNDGNLITILFNKNYSYFDILYYVCSLLVDCS